MDTVFGWQMGLPVHVDRTPLRPFGSRIYPPTFGQANQPDMFTNRIGFGPRLGAVLIDSIFIILITTPLMLLGITAGITAFLGLDDAIGGQGDEQAFAVIGIGLGVLSAILVAGLISIGYGLIEAFTGASPGKRVLGLQVANEDGSKGDTKLFLLRWALKNSGNLLTFILPGISSIFGLVFFFGCFATLGEKKQALHDIIMKSAVLKKDNITG